MKLIASVEGDVPVFAPKHRIWVKSMEDARGFVASDGSVWAWPETEHDHDDMIAHVWNEHGLDVDHVACFYIYRNRINAGSYGNARMFEREYVPRIMGALPFDTVKGDMR